MKLEQNQNTFNTPNDIPHYPSTAENSKNWKLWHGINYMFGGTLFVFGSLCYYPFVNNYVAGDVLGGWLFTIGSLNFLLADLTEWSHFRFGCVDKFFEPNLDSFKSYLRRAEMGLNFFLSAIGSLLYLLGSIYFIPAMNNIALGEYLFIYGSIIIFFSQALKCYRSLVTNEKNPEDRKVDIENVKADMNGFLVDLFAGLGGLFYTIGTYLFMEIVTTQDLVLSVHFFILGGSSFFASGVFMQLRYFKNCIVSKVNTTNIDPVMNRDSNNDPEEGENNDAKERLIH